TASTARRASYCLVTLRSSRIGDGMRTLFILCVAASLCPAQDGAALFAKHCAGCHQPGSATRAPIPSALKVLSKERILGALELGSMVTQGAGLTAAERLTLAPTCQAPPRSIHRGCGATCVPPRRSPFRLANRPGPDGGWTRRTRAFSQPRRRVSTARKLLASN